MPKKYEKQVITVPLGVPLDESVNPDLIENKAVVTAENCIYDKYLRTKRITGFSETASNTYTARIQDIFTEIYSNFTFGNCYLLDSIQYLSDTADRILAGSSITNVSTGYQEYYHLSESVDGGADWSSLGYLPPVKQKTISSVGLDIDCSVVDADSVATEAYIYVAAVNGFSRNNIDITVLSAATGTVVYTYTTSFMNQQNGMRCVKSATKFICIFKDNVSSFINYVTMPLNMGSTPTSGTLLAASINAYPEAEYYLVPGTEPEGRVVLAYIANATGQLNIVLINPTTMALSATFSTFYSALGVILGYLANRPLIPTTDRIGVLYTNVANEVRIFRLDTTCLAIETGPFVFGTIPLSAAHEPLGGGLIADRSHTGVAYDSKIVWWVSPYQGPSETASGTAPWNMVAPVQFNTVYGWVVCSKPFQHLGRAHIWLSNRWAYGAAEIDPKMVCVAMEYHGSGTGWTIPVTSYAHDEFDFKSSTWQSPRVSNSTGNVFISVFAQSLSDQLCVGVHRVEFGSTRNRCRISNRYIDTGCGLRKISRTRLVPIGFYTKPLLVSLTPYASGGGSVTNPATYTYCFVYEYIDDDGEIHRSTPSVFSNVSLAVPGHNAVDIYVRTLSIGDRTSLLRTKIAVYRNSQTDLSNFHYIGSVSNNPDVISVRFYDVFSDVVCEQGRPLYTTGGVLANDSIRPSGLVLQQNERIWCVPDQYPNQLWASKYLAAGVAPEFSYVLVKEFPEDIVALQELSGRLVLFGKEKVYVFNTLGGISDLGIGNWNDIDGSLEGHGLRTDTSITKSSSVGILYQRDTDGMLYLSNVPGSASILENKAEDSLGSIIDAVDIDQNQQMLMLSSNNKLIIWDYKHNQWSSTSVFTGLPMVHIGHGRQNNYYLADTSKIYKSNSAYKFGTYIDIRKKIRTGWLKPGIIVGYHRVWWINLCGKFPTNSVVNVRVYYDYNDANYSDYSFTNTSDLYTVRIKPSLQKCSSLSVEVTEQSATPIELTAVELELAVKGLHPKPVGKDL